MGQHPPGTAQQCFWFIRAARAGEAGRHAHIWEAQLKVARRLLNLHDVEPTSEWKDCSHSLLDEPDRPTPGPSEQTLGPSRYLRLRTLLSRYRRDLELGEG